MAIPALFQSVSTGMDNFGITTFTITFPNASLANNLLTFGFQCNSAGTVTSVKDNNNTSWTLAASETNATFAQTAYIYYLPNAPAGTTEVVVTVTGLTTGSPNCKANGWFKEFYNVATSSPLDVVTKAMATPSKSAGSFTPTANGDLIIHWGMDLSDTDVNGGHFYGTSITPGTGFTLDTADLQVGSCVQFQVQTTAGAINPAFTTSGSATWGSLAVAFKSASAGTAPGSGIYIAHVHHSYLCGLHQAHTAPLTLQFPSSGNCLVAQLDSGDVFATAITDGSSNSWVLPSSALTTINSAVSQYAYAPNATTSSSYGTLAFTLNATTTGDATVVLYDVVNAATTNVLGNAANTNGNQTTAGNITSVSLNPTASNGLIFAGLTVAQQTINGLVGSTYICDTVVNAFDDNASGGGTSTSSLDEDNGYGHQFNTSLTPATFVWTAQTGKGTSSAVGFWGSSAIFINPAASPLSAPVPVQGPINGTSTSSTTTAATFPANTTTGNAIVVITNAFNSTFRTVSSIAVNHGSATFTKIVSQVGNASGYGPLEAWVAYNITGSGGTPPTVTATFSGSNTNADIVIWELTNVPTTLTQDGTASGKAGTTATTMTAPAITTTNPNDIIFSAFAPSFFAGPGAAGWNFLETASNFAGMMTLGVGTTQTALAATCTQSSSGIYGAITFALKGLAGATSYQPAPAALAATSMAVTPHRVYRPKPTMNVGASASAAGHYLLRPKPSINVGASVVTNVEFATIRPAPHGAVAASVALTPKFLYEPGPAAGAAITVSATPKRTFRGDPSASAGVTVAAAPHLVYRPRPVINIGAAVVANVEIPSYRPQNMQAGFSVGVTLRLIDVSRVFPAPAANAGFACAVNLRLAYRPKPAIAIGSSANESNHLSYRPAPAASLASAVNVSAKRVYRAASSASVGTSANVQTRLIFRPSPSMLIGASVIAALEVATDRPRPVASVGVTANVNVRLVYRPAPAMSVGGSVAVTERLYYRPSPAMSVGSSAAVTSKFLYRPKPAMSFGASASVSDHLVYRPQPSMGVAGGSSASPSFGSYKRPGAVMSAAAGVNLNITLVARPKAIMAVGAVASATERAVYRPAPTIAVAGATAAANHLAYRPQPAAAIGSSSATNQTFIYRPKPVMAAGSSGGATLETGAGKGRPMPAALVNTSVSVTPRLVARIPVVMSVGASASGTTPRRVYRATPTMSIGATADATNWKMVFRPAPSMKVGASSNANVGSGVAGPTPGMRITVTVGSLTVRIG